MTVAARPFRETPTTREEGEVADRLDELFDAATIERRVAELAAQVSDVYRDGDLVLVGVLKGAFVFLADLIRRLEIPVAIDFLRVASYGVESETSGVVEIRKDLEMSVAGRDVLIVEDILDTGLTVDFLVRHLHARKPRTVRVCALLDKPHRRRVAIDADFVGFEVGDHFVVGYGLDCNEKYRYLPMIAAVRRNAESRTEPRTEP